MSIPLSPAAEVAPVLPPFPSRLRRALAAVVALLACALDATPAAAAEPQASSALLTEVLAKDMLQPAEVLPRGAPSWGARPRLNYGKNPRGFTAFIPWGQLYNCATGNPQPSARVQLAQLRGYLLSKRTGKWVAVRTDDPIRGSLYREDYAGDQHWPSDMRLVEGVPAVSVPLGRNYHFVPQNGRVSIDPADVAGVTILMAARLVPGTYDPAAKAPCYVLSVGADYWRSLTAVWSNQTNNDDVGIGRFKRVQSNWRLHSMTTQTQAELTRIPMPFSLPAAIVR